MSGFEQPNYTQTPNAFFDKVMPEIDTVAELKVTLCVIRQTFGYHKTEDELSLSRIMALTGLRRESVVDGTKRALKRGTIARKKVGQSYSYRAKVVGKPDHLEEKTSRQTGPLTSRQTGPTKETEKESTPTGEGKPSTFEVKDVQATMLQDLHERLRDRGFLEKRPLTNSYKGRLAGEIKHWLKTREVKEVWRALDRVVDRWPERALYLTDAFNDRDSVSQVQKPNEPASKLV